MATNQQAARAAYSDAFQTRVLDTLGTISDNIATLQADMAAVRHHATETRQMTQSGINALSQDTSRDIAETRAAMSRELDGLAGRVSAMETRVEVLSEEVGASRERAAAWNRWLLGGILLVLIVVLIVECLAAARMFGLL